MRRNHDRYRGRRHGAVWYLIWIALILALCAGGVYVWMRTSAPASPAPDSGASSAPDQPGSDPQPDPAPAPQQPAPEPEPQPDPVDALLAQMTREEKVGQLFLIRPESLDTALTPDQVHDGTDFAVTAWSDDLAAALEARPAGGIALFGKNVVDPAQLSALTAALSGASDIPLLLAIDEEGGRVARIGRTDSFDVPRFESAQAVAAQGTGAVADMYAAIGGYLKEYGLNLDFAPVADVDSNPENPVIGSRAFSGDPDTVAAMVSAALGGLHRAGIMGCIKHFPGHGDTADDTHTGYVQLDKTWDELLSCELVPFLAALDRTDLVMASHITLPAVSHDSLPASLSREILTDRLRGELGYGGVIITDSLAMGAITQNYSSDQCAVLALQAGADLLLMPYDYAAAFDGVLAAVERGDISESRLDESVRRILTLKSAYGLLPGA